jgi:hypothetical protein
MDRRKFLMVMGLSRLCCFPNQSHCAPYSSPLAALADPDLKPSMRREPWIEDDYIPVWLELRKGLAVVGDVIDIGPSEDIAIGTVLMLLRNEGNETVVVRERLPDTRLRVSRRAPMNHAAGTQIRLLGIMPGETDKNYTAR